MDDEQSKQFVDKLLQEYDGLSTTLSEMRRERKNMQLGSIQQVRSFIMKIGELSFILGAAVIPLMKDFASGSNAGYLFAAIGGLIANGLVALWKSKSILETDDDIATIGLDEEIIVEEYKHKLERLISYPDDEAYVQEWLNAREKLVNSFSVPQDSENRISFWLDGFVAVFAIGAILLARVIWPFSQNAFLWSFVGLLVLILFLVAVSYFLARERKVRRLVKKAQLKAVNIDRADWQKGLISKAREVSERKRAG